MMKYEEVYSERYGCLLIVVRHTKRLNRFELRPRSKWKWEKGGDDASLCHKDLSLHPQQQSLLGDLISPMWLHWLLHTRLSFSCSSTVLTEASTTLDTLVPFACQVHGNAPPHPLHFTCQSLLWISLQSTSWSQQTACHNQDVLPLYLLCLPWKQIAGVVHLINHMATMLYQPLIPRLILFSWSVCCALCGSVSGSLQLPFDSFLPLDAASL